MNDHSPQQEYRYGHTELQPGDFVLGYNGGFKFILSVNGHNITYVFQSNVVETPGPYVIGTSIIKVAP